MAVMAGLAMAACAEPNWPTPQFLTRYAAPLHIAHRGGRLELPENTLYAYDYALTVLGTDVLEVDVRRTCDGQLVILHDEDLQDILQLPNKVAETTLDFLRAQRIPLPVRPGVPADVVMPVGDPRRLRVPTFDEVVRRYRNCLINVEVKDVDDTDILIADLRARVATGFDIANLCFASFSDVASRRMKAAFPGACHTYPSFGAGCAALPRRLPGPARRDSIDCPEYDLFALPDEHNLLSRALVQSIHGMGRAIHVWTIDDKTRMRELLDWGVDGIMSDRPAVLRELMDERGLPRRSARSEPRAACEIVPIELVDSPPAPPATCAPADVVPGVGPGVGQ
jgi:glycerophosphoryl diester phosphodiesterase